jgi:peptidyl-prolyl cis-trans isomerase NIMA-interacting 1
MRVGVTVGRQSTSSPHARSSPALRPGRVVGAAAAAAFVGALVWAQLPEHPATPAAPPDPSSAPAASPGTVSPDAAVPLTRVGAAHVLVAYRGAERAPPSVSRTREEAQKRAEEALGLVQRERMSFADAVDRYSDDASTRPSHGDIGNFERLAMPAAFSDAAFALEIGQYAPRVVETPLGFHVIRRTR